MTVSLKKRKLVFNILFTYDNEGDQPFRIQTFLHQSPSVAWKQSTNNSYETPVIKQPGGVSGKREQAKVVYCDRKLARVNEERDVAEWPHLVFCCSDLVFLHEVNI